MNIEELVRPNIKAMEPYSTARDEFGGTLGIFLDANESPYPTGWNRYPDPHQKKLKERIAEIKKIDPRNLFLGNGSDEAIDLVYRIFCTPGQDNAVIITPSYGMYSVCAEINDVAVKSVLLNEDFSLPVERLLKACNSQTKIMMICTPNNPTGNAFPKEQILDLADRFNGILVVDEAYSDFSYTGSIKDEIERHPNIIVLQTCSKAYAMASLRIGLAIADEYIISLMSNVKYPYNISKCAQESAMKVLERDTGKDISEIVAERERVKDALCKSKVVGKVYPSDANFLLAKVDDADRMYDFLTTRGIIVRNRTRMPLCQGCLRITIGLRSENDELIKAIEEYEKSYIH